MTWTTIEAEGQRAYRERVAPPLRHYEVRENGAWIGGLSVRDDGQILAVNVQHSRRRQGIATRLYRLACERGHTLPPSGATAAGRAWAASLAES